MTTQVPDVLFVCAHKAGRSQMAAALLNRRVAGRVRVRSGGSAPATELNAQVVEAMREIGIDITNESPKALSDESPRATDVVVALIRAMTPWWAHLCSKPGVLLG